LPLVVSRMRVFSGSAIDCPVCACVHVAVQS
jgi:hypothetical protein